MVRVLTDRFLGQIEIGQIGRVTYPAFGFDEGFVGVVVGWRESLTARLMADPEWCAPKAAGWCDVVGEKVRAYSAVHCISISAASFRGHPVQSLLER
jgi:hypothetical protein